MLSSPLLYFHMFCLFLSFSTYSSSPFCSLPFPHSWPFLATCNKLLSGISVVITPVDVSVYFPLFSSLLFLFLFQVILIIPSQSFFQSFLTVLLLLFNFYGILFFFLSSSSLLYILANVIFFLTIACICSQLATFSWLFTSFAFFFAFFHPPFQTLPDLSILFHSCGLFSKFSLV